MPDLSFSEFTALLALEGRPPSAGSSALWCALTRQADVATSKITNTEYESDRDNVPTQEEMDRARAFLAEKFPRSQSPVKLQFDPIIYRSPRGLFSVTFVPDFAVQLDDYDCAIHLWPNGKPVANVCFIEVALGIIATAARAGKHACPQDVALLTLDSEKLYRVSDTCDRSSLAHDMIRQMENLFLTDVLVAEAAANRSIDRRWP